MLIFSLAFGCFLTAQTNRESKGLQFSNDREKQEWIQSHPEEYKKMGGTIKSTTPEFKNQAEKDAWVESQKPKKEELKKNVNVEATISTEAEKDAYLKNRQETIYMSQSEFNSLPTHKKEAVLADKKFIIVK